MGNQNIRAKSALWTDDPALRRLFQRRLLKWYARNRRDLPWRENSDPYRVWISEVMLQQTRVTAVVPHYHKFLKRFPTVYKLAAARESSVLAAWSGLGYYRRARMLHAASKKVVVQHNGKLPNSFEELRALPGIGRYTSAAIASIAYGKPFAVVDANVRRVVERCLGRRVPHTELWQIAATLLNRGNPRDFNQALMELGAIVCLPQAPKCSSCPVTEHCAGQDLVGKPPPASVRTKTAGRRTKRTICYALDRRNGSVFLVKRSDDASVMPGMWELPEIAELTGPNNCFFLRHSITVTDFDVCVVEVPAPGHTSGKWMKYDRMQTLPLTGLARKILRAADVI